MPKRRTDINGQPSEYGIEKACERWVHQQGGIWKKIPGGENDGLVGSSDMPAFPDRFVITPIGESFLCEVKKKGKYLETAPRRNGYSQVTMHRRLIGMGYIVITVRSVDELAKAWELINDPRHANLAMPARKLSRKEICRLFWGGSKRNPMEVTSKSAE